MDDPLLLEYDFNKELDLTIDSSKPFKETSITAPTKIFLTGGTGLIGSYLLKELLTQTAAEIYCLCRKKSLQKLLSLVSFWNLTEKIKKRVHPVIGDMSKPFLGLEEDTFAVLSEIIDMIYHCGAAVSVGSYHEMKSTTVNGTKELIRFAHLKHTKPIFYISTVGVYMSVPNIGVQRFYEEALLKDGKGLLGGYTQSKWVAEKLMHIANSKRLPVCIIRPARIISPLVHLKQTNSKDNFYRLLSLFLHTQRAPKLLLSMGFIPANFACKVFFHLARKCSSYGKTFNLVNSHVVSLKEIVECLNHFGNNIKFISYSEWINTLRHSNCNISDKYHFFTSPVYKNLSYFECMQYFSDDKFSSDNLQKELMTTKMFKFPKSREIIKTYCNHVYKKILKERRENHGFYSSSL